MKTKPLIFLFSVVFYINICCGQKPSIDFSAIGNWPSIIGTTISNDGDYLLYRVKTKPTKADLVVTSVDKAVNMSFPDLPLNTKVVFTEDSRKVIFLKTNDTLSIIDLKTNENSIISNCLSFALSKYGNGNWMTYLLRNKDLHLINLKSGENITYPNVEKYLFSDSGRELLAVSKKTGDTLGLKQLRWIDVASLKASHIWNGTSANSFAFDQSQTKLVFIDERKRNLQIENSIWYFEKGMDSANKLIDNYSLGIGENYLVEANNLEFSADGKKLFFKVSKRERGADDKSEGSKVHIWSYNDQFVHSEQIELDKLSKNKLFQIVINLDNRKINRLEQDNDDVMFSKLNTGSNSDYLLTKTNQGLWKGYTPFFRSEIYVVNTNDGARFRIQKDVERGNPVFFSPGGKYIYWYDRNDSAYFFYNIREKRLITNITAKIPFPVYTENWDVPSAPVEYGLAGWIGNDDAVLIYDRYDIWKVDPEGTKPSSNITNGYGRKKKVKMRLVNWQTKSVNDLFITGGDTLILCGFSETKKTNGFFKKSLNAVGNPIQLVMSPELFYFPERMPFVGFSPGFLQKSRYSGTFCLTRSSTKAYPNLYITKNFRDFTAMSELNPHAKYNWITSEMIHWKTFDAKVSDGILFKPQDFDPRKKYPVIFYFYERLSDGLNVFIKPELCQGALNIPLFVSQGYLVFCPDIHFKVGYPGESAYNYVVSAANMLAKKPWVDSKRMGIQGHSWGGYQVNYLLTRTNLFAAACSAAGPTNFVSEYNSLWGSVLHEAYGMFERGQSRIGTSLWANPKLYINNSPVFRADKIQTPLLIMHNDNDRAVVWSQGMEFYLSLRRLRKKAWMLQYEGQGHEVVTDKDKIDFSTRLTQFFDHYLKGMPAPSWMTDGIPAKLN